MKSTKPGATVTPTTKPEQPPLDPAEWDFRGIAKEEVWAVEIYEYARECEWVRESINRWLGDSFPDWEWAHASDGTDSTPRNTGRSITIVEALGKGTGTDFIEGICKQAPIALKDSKYWPVLHYSQNGLPPFQKWPAQQRADAAWSAMPWGNSAFRVIPPKRHGSLILAPSSSNRKRNKDSLKYTSHIDHSQPRNKIIKDFSEWLKERESEMTGLKKIETRGRSNTPPFEEIRWLSAYRLSRQAKMSYKKAMEFLLKHQRENPNKTGESNVSLPNYASQAAWSGAIKKAKSHILSLFPPPRVQKTSR